MGRLFGRGPGGEKSFLKQTAGPQDALMEAPQDGAPGICLWHRQLQERWGSGEEASLQAVPAGNAGSGSTGTGNNSPGKEKRPQLNKGRKGLGPG